MIDCCIAIGLNRPSFLDVIWNEMLCKMSYLFHSKHYFGQYHFVVKLCCHKSIQDQSSPFLPYFLPHFGLVGSEPTRLVSFIFSSLFVYAPTEPFFRYQVKSYVILITLTPDCRQQKATVIVIQWRKANFLLLSFMQALDISCRTQAWRNFPRLCMSTSPCLVLDKRRPFPLSLSLFFPLGTFRLSDSIYLSFSPWFQINS